MPACLALVVLFSSALPRPIGAREVEGLDFKYMYYWDRNGVRNHTPAILFLKKLSLPWSLRWQQEVDMVSGASRRLGLRLIGRQGDRPLDLDGVSGASRREIRHSEKATMAYAKDGRAASGSFYFSDENDYTSYSPSLGGTWDFHDRNTTVGADVALFIDEMRPRGSFAGLGGDRKITSATVTFSQILTRRSLAGLTVNGIYSAGYLGHPYNPVALADGSLILENLPDDKSSLAVTGQITQGYTLGGRLGSVRLEARYYRDTWKLASGTADLQLYQYFTESGYFRLRARGYAQEAAAFAKDTYAGDEVYRTADIRYYGFSSLTLGLKLGSAFAGSWGESALLPDRWDISYDHGMRDTRGEEGTASFHHYQLFPQDQYYLQGTLMLGLSFDL